MARTDPPSMVSDAGPIIHLDELGCLDLLGDFAEVVIPRQVWSEVLRHRPSLTLPDVPGASIVDVPLAAGPRSLALARSLGLHAGEIEALIVMEGRPDHIFLCDDAAARLAAESLGFRVHGTIGVLVRAARMGSRPRDQVLSLLREIPNRSTLHISARLLANVIARIEQEPSQ